MGPSRSRHVTVNKWRASARRCYTRSHAASHAAPYPQVARIKEELSLETCNRHVTVM